MMIECEVKTGQTVESIENTRRERGDGVGVKLNEKSKLKKVCRSNRRNRYRRLSSPLKASEGREVIELHGSE